MDIQFYQSIHWNWIDIFIEYIKFTEIRNWFTTTKVVLHTNIFFGKVFFIWQVNTSQTKEKN